MAILKKTRSPRPLEVIHKTAPLAPSGTVDTDFSLLLLPGSTQSTCAVQPVHTSHVVQNVLKRITIKIVSLLV